LQLTAFDRDQDASGNPDDLFATGVVEPSPDYAQCCGSRCALRINRDCIRHESDLSGTE
jgi:hypothetical protein